MHPILAMQRSAGNRAVSQALGGARTTTPSAAVVQRDADPAAPASGLIVEDDVTDLRPEQLRRTAFLAQANSAATDATNAALGPLADRGAAELQGTAARYSGQSAAVLESSVRAEVAGASAAGSAPALIEAIRQAASEEATSRVSAGVPDAAADVVDSVAGAASQVASTITDLFFKPLDGASPTGGAGEIGRARSLIGAGEPAPSGLRSEVERVTGADLGDVRVHRGEASGQMAAGLGARAFTVGRDVVIAADEPSAGQPAGDALLAHELAHAAQQSGADDPHQKAQADDTTVGETAADDVAAESVVGLWTGLREQLAGLGSEAGRRVKSGLKLQRCGKKGPDPTPKIDSTKEALNKKVLEGMDAANKGAHRADRGVHYPFNYQAQYPDAWAKLKDPGSGYANPAFWEMDGFMRFRRRRGVSASAAMDAWFAGPTIADCATVATASEVNAVRAAIGDMAFDTALGGDEKAGEWDPAPAVGGKRARRNLMIAQGMEASGLGDLMKDTASGKDAGAPGHRNVQPGEWHYFQNHPAYPQRHPAGFWSGENALYQGDTGGKQIWTGFGATYDEETMNQTLVKEYNLAPTGEDTAKKTRLRAQYGPDVANWPTDVKKFFGDGPASITVPELIAAGGGFVGTDGQTLDPAKVAAMRARLAN